MINKKIYIYFLGICGTGMGTLAGMLKTMGYKVCGSDQNIYPPMSDKLFEWEIPVFRGYDVKNLYDKPDLVIIGNVIREDNIEAQYIREKGLSFMSMPQAIYKFGIGEKKSIVVSGTHGKTTITSLLAHTLLENKYDPSYLVGGVQVGNKESFHVGQGKYFVIEGDEYDTAYFDKKSKFLHYQPQSLIINSLEFDHADIFSDIKSIENMFSELLKKVQDKGHVAIWNKAKRALELSEKNPINFRKTIYGMDEECDLYAKNIVFNTEGVQFEAIYKKKILGVIQAPLWGDFNVQNILAVIAVLNDLGLSIQEMKKGISTFKGVKRRMQVLDKPQNITIVDDFGHHPTAISCTLSACKKRFEGKKIWAIFEPRSATNRLKYHQQVYVDVFSHADSTIIATHNRLSDIPVEKRFDPKKLVEDLKIKGKNAYFIPLVDDIINYIMQKAKAGDVVIIFSNGDFSGLCTKLIYSLKNKE